MMFRWKSNTIFACIHHLSPAHRVHHVPPFVRVYVCWCIQSLPVRRILLQIWHGAHLCTSVKLDCSRLHDHTLLCAHILGQLNHSAADRNPPPSATYPLFAGSCGCEIVPTVTYHSAVFAATGDARGRHLCVIVTSGTQVLLGHNSCVPVRNNNCAYH